MLFLSKIYTLKNEMVTMKKHTLLFIFVCFMIGIIFSRSTSAEDKDTKFQKKQFYVAPFASYHVIPGFLLKLEADVYPKDGLQGHMEGLRVGRFLNNKYAVGAVAFHTDVNGSGLWGHKDEETSHWVADVTRGVANIEIFGIGAEGARRFYIFDNLALLLRLGLGIGHVDVRFHGIFDGHLIQDSGIVIHESAKESHHRIIPIIGLGAELEWNITHRLSLVAGPYWNTGLGAEASLAYCFDIF